MAIKSHQCLPLILILIIIIIIIIIINNIIINTTRFCLRVPQCTASLFRFAPQVTRFLPLLLHLFVGVLCSVLMSPIDRWYCCC